jgi:two-component system, OmpR family, sensor kinase
VLAIAIVGLDLPLIGAVRQRDVEKAQERAIGHARASAAVASELGLMQPKQRAQLQVLSRRAVVDLQRDFGDDPLARAIFVLPDRTLAADSGDPAAARRKDRVALTSRRELRQALQGRVSQQRRHSDQLGADIEVTAFPIMRDGQTLGAVRLTQSASSIDDTIGNDWLRALVLGLLVVAPLGLAAAVVIARVIARPLRDLGAAAATVSAGDLTARTPVRGSKEQRMVAQAFNEMTERLEATLGAQQEFVANASHQLRTPLTGIRLRIEVLRRGLADPASVRHADAALDEVDRLTRIVEELLVLSRAGQQPDAPAVADLDAAAADAVERWRAAAADAGIELRLVNDAGPCHVRGARADVDRAIDVLLENALAYSPPQTTVTVMTHRGTLEVLDEGPGLAPDETDAVFERFYRGRASRDGAPGTGLGLAIVRELAGRWGGDARLVNRPEGGARAEVSLPPVEAAGGAARDFTMA